MKGIYTLLLVGLIGLTSNISYGQNKDSMNIEELIRRCNSKIGVSKKLALELVNKAENNSKKLGSKDLEAVSYYTHSMIYAFYDNKDSTELWLLNWLEIRASQNAQKKRWALKGLQEFYLKHREIEKLDKTNWMFLEALEEEFCISGENKRCNYEYRVGALYMINEMVSLGEYDKAEAYFLRVIKKSGEEPNWYSGDLIYFQIEEKVSKNKDLVSQKELYEKWFTTILRYSNSQEIISETVNIIIGSKTKEAGIKELIAIIESAYPSLDNENKNDFLRKLPNKSISFFLYKVVILADINENKKEIESKVPEIFKIITKGLKELNAKSIYELKYVLKNYGIVSSSKKIKKSSIKLLKKLN